MSKHRKNRLQSFWPTSASNVDNPALPDARQLAANFEPIVENVGAAIATHPRASLTLAAAIGAALGWFIKRK